ncbi:hypothetical protein [Pseudaestuariivita sp.]|uniref:hypothetical protein n=1 Tax=Pseudaestuariivita sp. TaxID=2211669 RepID=UPI0040599AF9
MISLFWNGANLEDWTVEELLKAGVPQSAIGEAAKDAGAAQIIAMMENYRARIGSASAGKLAEYRIKEEIGRDPTIASESELEMLDREAAARGMDRAGLLAMINAQAAIYRNIALLIGALEAEAKAAIHAIPDDAPDFEARIAATIAASKAEADAAFAEATTLLNGGS